MNDLANMFICQTNIFPANTGDNISGPRRLNSSPLFTRWRGVLDKLEIIFHCPTSNMVVRCSWLGVRKKGLGVSSGEWEGSGRPKSVSSSQKKCLTGKCLQCHSWCYEFIFAH